MATRRKLSNAMSNRIFTKASLRTNILNLGLYPVRGGYRL